MPAQTDQIADAKPQPVHRKDYQPTPYQIPDVTLAFTLNPDKTIVKSTIQFTPSHGDPSPPPLVLDGRKDITLLALTLNGTPVPTDGYTLTPKTLTLVKPPSEAFMLEVEVEIHPENNTSLEGLYMSKGMFCSQCEPDGFRGITFFYDRPDVMSRFTVHIDAPKAEFPVLLSNGNLTESKDLPNGRHSATYEDPFLKPCYLFALVAGELQMKEAKFTTMSGRDVRARVYVQPQHIAKVDWALQSILTAMKWDEERFGREYDLDIFNVVAVDDFNMGAMENKSLNVFNSTRIVASPETATDAVFRDIQRIIGHEYFHNWTGNRITCRDWFQLTLKEGLTVFRDEEFSMDLYSRDVYRIRQALYMRNVQFPEDAGTMAHPIRPDSYVQVNNFYSPTVYRKGAAVIRMYYTLLGMDGFRKGMDLYFERHDGQAVRCEEFYQAMVDANGVDLSSLFKWYSQAGTPQVTVKFAQDLERQTASIHVTQKTPPTPGQAEKEPVMIPLLTGLVGKDGAPVMAKMQWANAIPKDTILLRADKAEQEFVLEGVDKPVVLSINRHFSAPVKLKVEGETDEDLLVLLAHDTDPFNRWDAGQKLLMNVLLRLYEAAKEVGESGVEAKVAAEGGVGEAVAEALRAVLEDPQLDGTFKALALTLPGTGELKTVIPEVDPVLLHHVRFLVHVDVATRLRPTLEAALAANELPAGTPYSPSVEQSGKRALKNTALRYLAYLNTPEVRAQCAKRYMEAQNMTDALAALSSLLDKDCPERKQCLDAFEERWGKQPLVMLTWLSLQASSNLPGNARNVQALMGHGSFSMTNPNAVRSVLGGFAGSPINFHAASGEGYEWYCDRIQEVDKVNSQVASRLAQAFTSWRSYDKERQVLMQKVLKRLAETEGLSDNVYEVVTSAVQD